MCSSPFRALWCLVSSSGNFLSDAILARKNTTRTATAWNRIALFAVIGLMYPFGILGGSDVKVTVVITIAKQEDIPVEIVGFKLPAQVGATPSTGIPSIVLRNKTSKQIRHVGLMNLLGNPRGVGGAEPKWAAGLGMEAPNEFRERPLGPNAIAEFAEVALRPYDVGLRAHEWQANCLHAAFYITRVEFVDGTMWRLDEGENYEVGRARLLKEWQDSIQPESTRGCDDSPAARDALGRLKGTAWVGSPSNAVSTKTVPFFAFSCSIRDDEAWCHL